MWRDAHVAGIENGGEIVTVTHNTKTGADTFKSGTYDDKMVTYTNIRCIISEKQITAMVEPEGRVQIKYYLGLFKYSQTISEGDVVTRSDGTKLYVVDKHPIRTGGVLSAWYTRMSAELVPHGQE